MSAALSYSSGESATPLLGDTIGGNFDATVLAFGGSRGAGRPAGWAALDLCGTGRRRRRPGPRAAGDGHRKGDRVGIWAPNCAEWTLTQYATAKIGAILVNINPAYRTSELEFVLNQSGCQLLIAAERLKTSDYAAMIAEVRATLPRPGARRACSARRSGRHCSTSGAALDRDGAGPRSSSTPTTRSTSSTPPAPPASRRARRSRTTTSSTTASSSASCCSYTEADRICIPVPFYHCFGMVMGNLAATTHGACMVIPGAEPSTRSRPCEAVAGGALHLAVRGADDVHRRARSALASPSYDLSSLRTGIMAGSPCPVEVMKQVMSRHGHARGVDLLRHDRDLAGLHPDPRRRLARPPRRHRRPGRAAPRGQGHRPADRRDRAARHARRALHPRLQRDARLLGRARQDRRGDRRRALDAHRRPGRRWTTTATWRSPAGSRTW